MTHQEATKILRAADAIDHLNDKLYTPKAEGYDGPKGVLKYRQQAQELRELVETHA